MLRNEKFKEVVFVVFFVIRKVFFRMKGEEGRFRRVDIFRI